MTADRVLFAVFTIGALTGAAITAAIVRHLTLRG